MIMIITETFSFQTQDIYAYDNALNPACLNIKSRLDKIQNYSLIPANTSLKEKKGVGGTFLGTLEIISHCGLDMSLSHYTHQNNTASGALTHGTTEQYELSIMYEIKPTA